MFTRKTEVRFPVLYITQIVSLAASVAIFILISIFWATAAFRVGQISPEITQTMFDLGWISFLWAGPAFYLWALSLAFGILWNPPEHQLFPRWSGWFTVVAVLSWSPGLIFMFWNSGPAAYNGPLPTWIALVTYGAWTVVMTVDGWKAISRQDVTGRKFLVGSGAPGSGACGRSPATPGCALPSSITNVLNLRCTTRRVVIVAPRWSDDFRDSMYRWLATSAVGLSATSTGLCPLWEAISDRKGSRHRLRTSGGVPARLSGHCPEPSRTP